MECGTAAVVEVVQDQVDLEELVVGHPTEGSGYAGGGAGRASVPNYDAVASLHAKYASGGGGGGGVGGPNVIDSSGTYLTRANGLGGHGAPGVVVISYTT